MGAFSAKFFYDAKLTEQQVIDRFIEDRNNLDKAYKRDYELEFGYQPYGSYSDIDVPRFDSTVYKNIEKATDICLQNCEKWGRGYAVKTYYLPYGGKRKRKVWMICGWVPE